MLNYEKAPACFTLPTDIIIVYLFKFISVLFLPLNGKFTGPLGEAAVGRVKRQVVWFSIRPLFVYKAIQIFY